MAFLDETGLEFLWQQIIAKLGLKADSDSLTSGDITVAEATHAASADSATTAVTADASTKSVQDASGNVITETYETKVDADATEAALTALINGKADASHVHDVATSEANGFMSATDKIKLDSIDPSQYAKSIGITVDENEDAVITWDSNILSPQGVEF